MDKNRIEIIITAFLIGVFILVAANSCKKIKQKMQPQSAAPPASAPLTIKPAAPPQGTLPKPVSESELTEWGRCPFSGKAYSSVEEEKISTIKLTGIIWDEKHPQALIGDNIAKEGDMVGGFQVIKINKDSVILSDGVKEIKLKLE